MFRPLPGTDPPRLVLDDEDDIAPDVPSHPQADVTLPNGQRLQASVLRRRRDRSGVWWCDLEIGLPDRIDDRRHGPAPPRPARP